MPSSFQTYDVNPSPYLHLFALREHLPGVVHAKERQLELLPGFFGILAERECLKLVPQVLQPRDVCTTPTQLAATPLPVL